MQILGLHSYILHSLRCFLRLADRHLPTRYPSFNGNVPVLHSSSQHSQRKPLTSVPSPHLMASPQEDIQTISWPEIVRRISAIRDENPITALSSAAQNDPDYTTPTAKLDAHDVANRIMRQENYLIALFNKDLLDLRLPLPRPLKTVLGLFGVYHESKQGTILTRALEWNLRFCLMDYLFDRSGRVRTVFLKDRNRDLLVKG